jgi:hypothetical protein
MAASNQIQPLRRAQLAAAEFQVRGLWVSGGGHARIGWFKPFRCAGKSRQGVVNESFIQ